MLKLPFLDMFFIKRLRRLGWFRFGAWDFRARVSATSDVDDWFVRLGGLAVRL